MNKYLVEFIGTFFLVFTVGMCVIKPDAGSFAPLAFKALSTKTGRPEPTVVLGAAARSEVPAFSALVLRADWVACRVWNCFSVF